jgi:hypothetical protein
MQRSSQIRGVLAAELRAALDDIQCGTVTAYARFRDLASQAGVMVAGGNVFWINGAAARALTSAWMRGQPADRLLDLLVVAALAHQDGCVPSDLRRAAEDWGQLG